MDGGRAGVSPAVAKVAPVLLAVLVLVAYLPSLDGGFLNWDDDWLIQRSPLFTSRGGEILGTIWTDFSLRTRFALGAEYLPIRDTWLLLEARLFGLDPLALRLVQLGLYLVSVLLMRGALLRTLADPIAAEVAAFAFALHPVHVESVAWMSGLKDVLALVFVGAALYAYAGNSRHRVWFVPLALLVAHFSKSMTVVALGLLVATDLAKRRRPVWAIYSLAGAGALAAVFVHVRVGRLMGMSGAPVGGTRWTALMTMGPVWLRYPWLSLWPGSLSLVHDVNAKTTWTLPAALGYVAIVSTGGVALALWLGRRAALPLAAWLWFWVPLVPVNQVAFPLQNLMADRYLFLSVMAVALGLGALASTRTRAGGGAAAAGLLMSLLAATYRSTLFSSSAAVFADATSKTTTSPVAPYQLGMALSDSGDLDGAARAFEEVLRRAPGNTGPSRRATNNLAKIYAHEGRLADAEAILERGIELWPTDRKMLRNLVVVLARRGMMSEAHAVEERLRGVDAAADYPD